MACRAAVRQAIHFFVNFVHFCTVLNGCILLTIGSIYTKLGDFANLGVLFQTMLINSC